MIFGFVIASFGYAVFYWGVHHFPGWDCPTNNGCRYSLLELLGVPKTWNIPKYGRVGLTPGGQLIQPNQSQNPENTKTPSALTPGGGGWINSVLDGVGAPKSFNNQNKLTGWNNCEGNVQGHSGTGINNPFNITADHYQPDTQGDLGAVNDAGCGPGMYSPGTKTCGVQAFSTMTLGIKGTIAKLNEPFAAAIKANLVNDGSFQDFASAVGASHWGTDYKCLSTSGS